MLNEFMDDIGDGTIWRYMDLAKFTSLLTTRSLYFSCPTTQFDDPYEGHLPKSHIEAETRLMQDLIDPVIAMKDQLAAQGMPVEPVESAIKRMKTRLYGARREAASKFGVSCWHESEYESAAMWKLYAPSGQGIAIEATIASLKKSLGDRTGLNIARVRYMDYDRDPIEKGHRHYGLFVKRKSFEHEKEIRATVLLPQPGDGIQIPCDLDVLITAVHVSPHLETYVREAVIALCAGTTHRLNKPVHQSSLFSPPDYGINVKTG